MSLLLCFGYSENFTISDFVEVLTNANRVLSYPKLKILTKHASENYFKHIKDIACLKKEKHRWVARLNGVCPYWGYHREI